jgi:hypothetical protein
MHSRFRIIGFASLAAIVGAALFDARPAAANPPASLSTAVPTRVLYVGDARTQSIQLFNADDLTRAPFASITAGVGIPFGIGVDSSGALYVANGQAVEVYKPRARSPFKALTDVPTPNGVGFGPHGTVAVSGLYPQGGMLAVYDNGSPRPTRIITFPPGRIRTEVSNPVFDSAGDLFIAVHQYPRGPANVLEFAPGSTTDVITKLPFGPALGIDAQNNIYVSFGSEIVEFQPGASQPFRRLLRGLVATTELAVGASGQLYVVNVERLLGQGPPGDVVEFGHAGLHPIGVLGPPAYSGAELSVGVSPGT